MSDAVLSSDQSRTTSSWFDRCTRDLLLQRLTKLQDGELTVHDTVGRTTCGTMGDLQATLRVHRPQFYRDALLGGGLSVAEAYLRGDWDCDDLTALFRIFARQQAGASLLDRGLARLMNGPHRLYHAWHANSRIGSRRNIAAHYDLGNDLFALMLDETLAYSSGIFSTPQTTLHDASVEKFDRICQLLDLQPDDHVLEIGTGWGGFALHAAEHYGCRITTTTISREQAAVARERFTAAGLDDRITLLEEDYRQLTGQYDKLVSIEMIEAVGHRYLDTYFRQCSDLLKPDGSFVLQAIVMPEQGYDQYLRSVDFIQRYVFPGGCLPSLGAMLGSMQRVTDFRVVHTADYAPHYAETLRHWRRRFEQRLDDVRRLGYDERFIRLWRYYLCYCEAAFDERCTGVVQMRFDKPGCRRDVTPTFSASNKD